MNVHTYTKPMGLTAESRGGIDRVCSTLAIQFGVLLHILRKQPSSLYVFLSMIDVCGILL